MNEVVEKFTVPVDIPAVAATAVETMDMLGHSPLVTRAWPAPLEDDAL